MAKELPFDPLPLFGSPHVQTFLSTSTWWIQKQSSETQLILLPDGDKLAMELVTPENWKGSDVTVLCVHGLCGSHESSYLLRLVNHLTPLGVKTARFNMRGCGSGKGLAKDIYHSGRSEDVFEAIKVLKEEFPESPIVLVGFSLGGNVVLKLAGELGSLGEPFLDQVIAVGPPVDLMASIHLAKDAGNGAYERYFYRLLRDEVHERHRQFKELPPIHLPKDLSLFEFDQLYTAPSIGYSDVLEYYANCSAIHYIEEISIPCRILFSEDDPIVSHKMLDSLDLPAHIEVYKTKKGGHIGFLGNPTSERGLLWLNSVLGEWILGTKDAAS